MKNLHAQIASPATAADFIVDIKKQPLAKTFTTWKWSVCFLFVVHLCAFCVNLVEMSFCSIAFANAMHFISFQSVSD